MHHFILERTVEESVYALSQMKRNWKEGLENNTERDTSKLGTLEDDPSESHIQLEATSDSIEQLQPPLAKRRKLNDDKTQNEDDLLPSFRLSVHEMVNLIGCDDRFRDDHREDMMEEDESAAVDSAIEDGACDEMNLSEFLLCCFNFVLFCLF